MLQPWSKRILLLRKNKWGRQEEASYTHSIGPSRIWALVCVDTNDFWGKVSKTFQAYIEFLMCVHLHMGGARIICIFDIVRHDSELVRLLTLASSVKVSSQKKKKNSLWQLLLTEQFILPKDPLVSTFGDPRRTLYPDG